MATLNTHVGVHHPEHGSMLIGPDVEVPEWAIPLIENPDVWAEAPDETVSTSTDPDESEDESEDEGDDSVGEESGEDVTVTIPAKAGPRATAGAWAAYALAKGFEVASDATRSEIIEALEVEGIPTE